MVCIHIPSMLIQYVWTPSWQGRFSFTPLRTAAPEVSPTPDLSVAALPLYEVSSSLYHATGVQEPDRVNPLPPPPYKQMAGRQGTGKYPSPSSRGRQGSRAAPHAAITRTTPRHRQAPAYFLEALAASTHPSNAETVLSYWYNNRNRNGCGSTTCMTSK